MLGSLIGQKNELELKTVVRMQNPRLNRIFHRFVNYLGRPARSERQPSSAEISSLLWITLAVQRRITATCGKLRRDKIVCVRGGFMALPALFKIDDQWIISGRPARFNWSSN
jgi:hypothetical protein